MVLEDLHWADEATLDVLRLLSRRIESVPALVLATYRDDELDREHPLRIVFYFPLVATPLAIPWAAADFVMPSAYDWLYLVGIGITTQFAQVFLTMGLSVERAGRATSVGYIQICFAIVWQITLFGQTPAVGTIVGAALIIAGTVAVSATCSGLR